MTSKPKTQDSPLKSKSIQLPSDLRNRSLSNSSPPKQQDKTVAEISIKEFLDFLKISYKVNEAIDNSSSDIVEKVSVDWKKLTSDALINRLKEREATLSKEKTEKVKLESPKKEESSVEKYPQSNNLSCSEIPSKYATRENSEEKLVDKSSSAGKITESNTHSEKLPATASLDRRLRRSSLGRKKSIGLKKEGSAESETSRSLDVAAEDRTPAKLLKKKLNEVLQEGILDSVLPYLLPKQHHQDGSLPAVKKLQTSSDNKKIGNSEKGEKSTPVKDKLELRRKSFTKNEIPLKNEKKDIEVVIHVCDEIKNLKKDFKCSQKLLISQMGYFAEVTTGQRLEDMDISVHCDVTIFDWLMKWVKKDSVSEEHWPTLDSSIVIPVLMSSAFLQMSSLQEHCLHYCKTHINDIIKESPNLSCINDNVLTRLANLFSNSEIENIIDKKDKIQSKLFCKLIVALTDFEPQPYRGHFSSLANIYRSRELIKCCKCQKLILRHMTGSILCVSSNMTMDPNGFVHSTHVYDSSWNLTDYVKELKADLKTWRKVYWRLWSDCHLLFCQACEEYFPVHHMNWCRFHTESVQYFPLENLKSVYHPIGRYSCCGERAYRFEVIKNISGCHYRDHITNPKTAHEIETLRIWNLHKEVIKEEAPTLLPPERVKFIKSRDEVPVKRSPGKDGHWWEGLELVPSKQAVGLFNKFWDTVIRKDDAKSVGNNAENKIQKSPVTKITTAPQNSFPDISSFSDSSDESCSSSNADNSEESYHSMTKIASKSKSSTSGQYLATSRLSYARREKKKRRKKRKKKSLASKTEGNRFWLPKLSTRCNQDNQRDFEERALRQIEAVLAKKLSGEGFRSIGNKNNHQIIPPGGIYVKLEQEWREAHCFSHGCPGSSMKARGSASYVNVNNSNFSVQKRSKSRGHR